MSKAVSIGELDYKTKTEAKEVVKQILNRYPLGHTLTGFEDAFIRDVIALHPATEDKIGCGIDHVKIDLDPGYGTTRCFYVCRVDGSRTDVSYIKCIDGESRRKLVRPALRDAILPQILAFKNAQFARGPQYCPYMGVQLTPDNCHVDHTPPMTFETLVTVWLRDNSLAEEDVQITGREDNQAHRVITNPAQIKSWTEFHQKHARLRLLSRRGNLSDSKIEAGLLTYSEK